MGTVQDLRVFSAVHEEELPMAPQAKSEMVVHGNDPTIR
jgi:hypothetical protein